MSYLRKIAFNRSCQLVSGAECRSLLLFPFSSSSPFRKIVWHVVTFHATLLLFSLFSDFHDVCKIISQNFFSKTTGLIKKIFFNFLFIFSLIVIRFIKHTVPSYLKAIFQRPKCETRTSLYAIGRNPT